MKYQIRKYRFEDDLLEIEWSEHDRIIHVAQQYETDTMPTIWTEHAVDEEQTSAKVVFRGTGEVTDDFDLGIHVGSSIHVNGRIVWHVYLLTETED